MFLFVENITMKLILFDFDGTLAEFTVLRQFRGKWYCHIVRKSPSCVILTTEGRKNLNTYTLMISDSSLTLRMTWTYSAFVAPKLTQNPFTFKISLHSLHGCYKQLNIKASPCNVLVFLMSLMSLFEIEWHQWHGIFACHCTGTYW